MLQHLTQVPGSLLTEYTIHYGHWLFSTTQIQTIHWSTRAVLDLLLGNPAGARFCRICKANPAGAGAGFHHIISHQ